MYFLKVNIRVTKTSSGNFIIDFEQEFVHRFLIKISLVNINKSNLIFTAIMKWVDHIPTLNVFSGGVALLRESCHYNQLAYIGLRKIPPCAFQKVLLNFKD